jgi:hypothetical protein
MEKVAGVRSRQQPRHKKKFWDVIPYKQKGKAFPLQAWAGPWGF